MSKRQDFGLDLGCYQEVTVVVTETDSAIDPSAATWTWLMSKEPGGEALLTKTVGSGLTVDASSSSGATIRITFTDADITEIGKFYHVLKMTIATKTRATTRGRVVVSPGPAASS